MRDSESWTVVSPTMPGDGVHLSDLPRTQDGHHILDLVAGEGGGIQRWAVVLSQAETAVGLEAKQEESWRLLRHGVALGENPAISIDVEVSEP